MSTKEDRVAAIREAIASGGGVIQFAKAMGVTHQAVYHWLGKGFVPIERALVIEALFKVDRARIIDPDLLRAINTPPVADYL